MNNFAKKFLSFEEEFKKLPLEEKEYLLLRINKIMDNTEFSSKHGFNTFKNIANLAKSYGVNLDNCNLMEIGSGKYSIFSGMLWQTENVQSFIAIDKYCEPFNSDYWKEIYINSFQSMIIKKHQLHNLILNKNWSEILKPVSIYKGDYLELNLDNNKFDFVYSMAVFEHIEEPEKVVEKLYNTLKPGGVSYHNIDLRPHELNKKSPVYILSFSDEEWNFLKTNKNNWVYLNRLRSNDWINLFKKFGFDILSVKTSNFESELTEQDLPNLDRRFQNYKLEDLNHAILNIVVKK
jgi:hypothetical protein